MSGRRDIGPCGHERVAIVGHYYQCVTMPECDGRPGVERCGKCNGTDLYDFTAPMVPLGARACRGCGAVRWSPTG